MKKKLIVFICVLISSFALSACGSKIELSNENSELIAQYAAGVLLKYDKNYNQGLSYTTLSLENETVKQENTEAIEETSEIEEAEVKKDTEENEIEVIEEEIIDEIESQGTKDLNQGLKIDGFDFTYSSYEFAEYYPNDGVYESMNYTINPKTGNQLLVLNFKVKNIASESQKLDLFSMNPQFDLILNNKMRTKALNTFLLNDLSTIFLDSDPGDTLNAVLLCEVALDFEKELSSIILEIGMNQEISNVILK